VTFSPLTIFCHTTLPSWKTHSESFLPASGGLMKAWLCHTVPAGPPVRGTCLSVNDKRPLVDGPPRLPPPRAGSLLHGSCRCPLRTPCLGTSLARSDRNSHRRSFGPFTPHPPLSRGLHPSSLPPPGPGLLAMAAVSPASASWTLAPPKSTSLLGFPPATPGLQRLCRGPGLVLLNSYMPHRCVTLSPTPTPQQKTPWHS